MLTYPNQILAVIAAVGALVIPACGGSETSSSAQGGAGGSAAGGETGGGGVAAGGSSTSGGASGTGGHEGVFGGNAGDRPSGTGGAAMIDASVDTSFCWGDAGRLVTSARACTQDTECAITVAPRCCGADGAVGILKSDQMAFASCFALPPNACQGLGCAKFIGYMTDTGKTTEYDRTVKNQLDLVTVHCIAKVCTTDVVVLDAGRD